MIFVHHVHTTSQNQFSSYYGCKKGCLLVSLYKHKLMFNSLILVAPRIKTLSDKSKEGKVKKKQRSVSFTASMYSTAHSLHSKLGLSLMCHVCLLFRREDHLPQYSAGVDLLSRYVY